MSESYKVALQWEDDNEVIVKVEPLEGDEFNFPEESSNSDDLVLTEDWTRDGEIVRRSYINNNIEANEHYKNVEEITFKIKDNINLENITGSISSTEIEVFKEEEVYTLPSPQTPIVYEQEKEADKMLTDISNNYPTSVSHRSVDPIPNNVENVSTIKPNTPGKGGNKIVFLRQVPKNIALKNAGIVRRLPDNVVVQNGILRRAPIYSPRIAGVTKLSQTSRILQHTRDLNSVIVDTRSYLRCNSQSPSTMPLKIETLTSSRKQANKTKTNDSLTWGNKCPTCQKIFIKRKHLIVHLKIHDVNAPKKPANKECQECGKKFPDNTQLSVHSRVHSGFRPYECKLCQKTFKHATSLARHMLSHTKERPHACDLCPKTYRNNSDLINHKRIHSNERPFKCSQPDCNKRFNDRCARNTHERIHRQPKHTCEICTRSFTQATTLKSHMVTHTHERPFECSICRMKFKSKVVLRSHLRTHAPGESSFQCVVCKATFNEKRTLARHIYVHKEKPFPCEFCKKWYFREDRYKAHVLTHSKVNRPFSCKLCPKRYVNEGYLNLHHAKAHVDKSIKDVERLRLITLKLNQAKVSLQCQFEDCGKIFKSNDSFRKHKYAHDGTLPFQCHYCKKSFKFKSGVRSHLLKHFQLNYFSCALCNRIFKHKYSIIRHLARCK